MAESRGFYLYNYHLTSHSPLGCCVNTISSNFVVSSPSAVINVTLKLNAFLAINLTFSIRKMSTHSAYVYLNVL